MLCPECGEQFPAEGILRRHREHEHPAKLELEDELLAEAAAARKAVAVEDNKYTVDGFLRSTRAQREGPSTYPVFGTSAPDAPPWEREAAALERDS